MINRKTFWLGFAAALAFGLVGCGTSSDSGPGTGGSGGMETGTAMVTVVHLAPEIPTAMSTAVDILVNGLAAIEDLEYGDSTGRVMLDAGTYTFGVAVAGDTNPVIELEDVPLSDGDDLTVVAYRTNDDPPVNAFVFSNSTDDLESGKGRVFVAHGANDPALDGVNIVVTDDDVTECETLIAEFPFGTISPGEGEDPRDLDGGEGVSVNVAFDLDDTCPPVTLGPVAVPVTADKVSILVAVDENTSNAPDNLAPELWAIVDASDTPLQLINTE